MIVTNMVNTKKSLLAIALTTALTACGGGGGGNSEPNPPPPVNYTVQGMAVKGPLQNAKVALYQFDPSKELGRGGLISEGQTDQQAQIKGLSLTSPLSSHYLLEFETLPTTIDLSTGKQPVISRLQTVVTADELKRGSAVYATPLSTLTLQVALGQWTNGGSLVAQLEAAEITVKSVLGFGLDDSVNLLNSSPILTDASSDLSSQIKVWQLRTANELSAALIEQLREQGENSEVTADEILSALARDLIDGVIDGSSNGTYVSIYEPQAVDLFTQPIEQIEWPNTEGKTIADMSDLLIKETALTGNDAVYTGDLSTASLTLPYPHVFLNADYDGDGAKNSEDADDDNDGVEDSSDLYPLDESESADTDGDGEGNNADLDDDNDGVLDVHDVFPLDATETTDNDADGIGDNADSDDDNDETPDAADAFPFNSAESLDTDMDGIGNNADADDDNDGVVDSLDHFPLDGNEIKDSDHDGIGDNADPDDDNDGVNDVVDAFPYDTTESLDTDADGTGNNADIDDDGDGTIDASDTFPLDPGESVDTDNDGIGNNADPDDDNDGHIDSEDALPLNALEWLDSDGDGTGNNADSDDDNDGVYDVDDAFPTEASESADFDGDGIGDNADLDDDNDGKLDIGDNLHFFAGKAQYAPKEQVRFRIRGRSNTGAVLNSSGGWHVQFYLYDMDSPDTRLTEYVQNGSYNASFNHDLNEWIVSFSAPDYASRFKATVSLYCSRASGQCDGGEILEDNSRDLYFFDVVCPLSGACEYQPDPEPGVNVSSSSGSSFGYGLIKRNNGELVAVYREFTTGGVENRIRRSLNNGVSWQDLSVISHADTEAGFIESSDGKLMLIQRCLGTICVYSSTDGVSWAKQELFETSDFAGCNTGSCDINAFSIDSVIQTHDGGFLLSYSRSLNGNYLDSDIYVTKSFDLANWSPSLKITAGDKSERHSSLIQLPDGSFMMALVSMSSNAIHILTSEDGVGWTEVQKISQYVDLGTEANLLQHNGNVLLFHNVKDKVYMREKNAQGQFVVAELVEEGAPFGLRPVVLQDGRVGGIYSQDLNNKRDVFFVIIDEASD